MLHEDFLSKKKGSSTPRLIINYELLIIIPTSNNQ